MKFVVSSTGLLSHLQAISRVISSKNTLPILDNFLFSLSGNTVEVTASDLETTFITYVELENVDGEGAVAIPARILTDILKEFPEQPLTFEINQDDLTIDIFSENGKYSIVGYEAEEFPTVTELQEGETASFVAEPDVLHKGIEKTHFAIANDELRPVMNGIFVEIKPDGLTFVASDAHKLVRYIRHDANAEMESSFILPEKPAMLLRSILPKESNEIKVEFDKNNAIFTLSQYKLVCRLIEGSYPNYTSVIPAENPNKLLIDRQDLYNTLKRVSVFSNQASNLVKLNLTSSQITISAQDIDFSISAYERLYCQYEGDEMEIGFKSPFLIDLLSNLDSTEVRVEMSEPSVASLIFPTENNENEDILMLIMPMMVK